MSERVLMTGRCEHYISSHFMFLFFAMCFVIMQQQVASLLYQYQMGVSLNIYRAAIGLYNSVIILNFNVRISFLPAGSLLFCFHVAVLLAIFFLMCSDIELNPGPNRSIALNAGHLNARSINISRSDSSIVNKFEEITSVIFHENSHIFAITETWLKESISNELYNLPGYYPLFRLDRSDNRRAGGVALYVASEFAPKRRFDLENSDFELLWVEVKIKSVKLLCGVCYRPEYSHNYLNISFLSNLQASFDQIGLEPNTFVVLLGDFNGHYNPGNPSACSDFGSLLYRWLECNNLSQIINESTRITESGETP